MSAVNARIDASESEAPIVKLSWFRRNYVRVAAAAAAIVVVFAVTFFLKHNAPSDIVTLASYKLYPQTSIVLPDGTSVSFSDSSLISYPEHFASDERVVNFEGDADFSVAKDTCVPFIIRCGDMNVEVVGTVFHLNAKRDAEKYVLDLVSGKVKMNTFDAKGNVANQIDVLPGERGVFFVNANKLEHLSSLDVIKESALNDHILDFDNVDLKTIIGTLEYIYGINVDLAENCENYKLTARFTNESVDHVLETITTVFDLQLSTSDSTYVIR